MTPSHTLPSRKGLYFAFVHTQSLPIGGGYFAILYPQDGHMPQLCVSDPVPVKKIVVKIELV